MDILVLLVFSKLRGPYQQNFFFIIRFYAILHITTIVHNKIISIVCSCFFFCLANIYRPCLGKVQLGRPNGPNPNQPQSLNFYLRRKIITKTFYSDLYALHVSLYDFHFFKFFFLNVKKACQNV